MPIVQTMWLAASGKTRACIARSLSVSAVTKLPKGNARLSFIQRAVWLGQIRKKGERLMGATMHKGFLFSAAIAALAIGGCTTVPAPDPRLDRELAAEEEARANRPIAVDEAPRPPAYDNRSVSPGPAPSRVVSVRDPRDTLPVERPRLATGAKPAFDVGNGFPRAEPVLAFARFDDAVAVSEAIGDSPPDFAFRLIGTDAWAWTDPSGEMLIVEGEGRATVQYFFGARDDRPQFIRTGTYGHAFADGRLIGSFHGNGAPVAERVFNNIAGEAEQLMVRGRSLYHAAEDRRWDRDTARRWTTIQPNYGGWLSTWVAPPLWSGDYGRYRQRPESRERHERRRLTRDQRRERAERFARWRNGGSVGAPPGPNDGTGGSIIPPRTPDQPGQPGNPGRPPRPPRDTGNLVPPPVDPVRVAPAVPTAPPSRGDLVPTPQEPTPMPLEPASPPQDPPARPQRDIPGWQGYATEQPQNPELVPTGDDPRGDEVNVRPERDARAEAEAAERARQMRAFQEQQAAEREERARAAASEAAANAARRAEEAEANRAEAAAAQQAAAERDARRRAEEDNALRQREAEEEAAAAQQAAAQREAARRAAAEAAARAAAEQAAAEQAATEARRREAEQPRSVDDSNENVRPD